MRTFLLVALAALAAACDRVPSTALTDCNQAIVPAVKTDILFVIDDSNSMAEEQAAVAANLDAFVSTLVNAPGQSDFQIGVTNTSVFDFASGSNYYPNVHPYGASPPPYPQGALIAIDPAGLIQWDGSKFIGPRILPSSSATLLQDFKRNVLVGTVGSGKEQPFRAMQLALEKSASGGVNDGFLRSGARLAVVLISDEDDCSDDQVLGQTPPVISTDPFTGNNDCHNPQKKALIDSVQSFVDYLRGSVPTVGGEQRDVLLVGVAGLDPNTSTPMCGDTGSEWCCWPGNKCSNCCGTVSCDQASTCPTAYDKGDRFHALALTLGGAGPATRQASVCGDFASTLQAIADLIIQEIPLQGSLGAVDWRLLAVGVTKADYTSVSCQVAYQNPLDPNDPLNTPNPTDSQYGVIYTPPQGGHPATLTFENACRLAMGEKVQINVICVQ